MKKTFLLAAVTLFSVILFSQNTRNTLNNDSIDVLKYNINLTFLDFNQQEFYGEADIQLVLMQNTNSISLSLLNQQVDSVVISNQQTNFSYNDTTITINLSQTYNQNDTINLKIHYTGTQKIDPSGWGGFYFTSSYAFNLGVGFRDVPHNYGRVWFPCQDNFTDRAYYEFEITVPENFTAVCNGVLLDAVHHSPLITYHWKLNQTIPTYLASVAIAQYSAVENIYNGISDTIPTYIYTSLGNENNAEQSFAKLNQVLSLFENRFGPYKWDRVGYVGVNFNGGAMEHATNIAYPASVIDGSVSEETLWAHELSHHWFGNLVTCRSSADMWLNEGWASYCESIFEEGIYGKTAFKNYVRNNHYYVLRYAPSDDNGYYAVSGIPENITYGSTVYKKGADVVHNLRFYLGDSLFFNSVKQYLNDFSFNDASSIDLRDSLGAYSGIDLTGFFNSWVFTKGFPQFDIDSFNVSQEGINYNVTVYVKQKLYHRENFYNDNRLPISFLKPNNTFVDTFVSFSGETGVETFSLDFNPVSVWLDRNEHLLDASVKQSHTFTNSGDFDYNLCDFKINISNIQDSAVINVIHNWVGPDFSSNQNEELIFSNTHYWHVNAILPDNFSASARFDYSRTLHDTLLRTYDEDSLVLLYRPNRKINWRIVSDNAIGGGFTGYLQDDTLKEGEYCFAFRVRTTKINYLNKKQNKLLELYPNPAKNYVNIKSNYNKTCKVLIVNTNGKKLWESKIAPNTTIKYNVDTLNGSVIAVLMRNNKKISSKKLFIKK